MGGPSQHSQVTKDATTRQQVDTHLAAQLQLIVDTKARAQSRIDEASSPNGRQRLEA